MFNKRERIFLSKISAWHFAEVNILNTLYLLKDKRKIHGRAMQTLLYELFGEEWSISNDLLYKLLNSLEKEGYVKSQWNTDKDLKKRHTRDYRIKDLGINRLNSLKQSYGNNVKDLTLIIDISSDYIWKNLTLEKKIKNPDFLLSNSLFTGINLLKLLNNEIYQEASGREIQESLKKTYRNLWIPSDGVLYPLLSEFEEVGYLYSTWDKDPNEEYSKKRTSRKYRITKKGEGFLEEMISDESGIRNKLFNVKNLCDSSHEYVYGNPKYNIKIITEIIERL